MNALKICLKWRMLQRYKCLIDLGLVPAAKLTEIIDRAVDEIG